MNTDIPRGIEVLVKKASVDPEFRTRLVEKRAEAAETIGLELTAAEAAMLGAISREQLEAIIARTTVEPRLHKVFMGAAAAVMVVALGATPGCAPKGEPAGERPDRPREKKAADEVDHTTSDKQGDEKPDPSKVTRGITSDRPSEKKKTSDAVAPGGAKGESPKPEFFIMAGVRALREDELKPGTTDPDKDKPE